MGMNNEPFLTCTGVGGGGGFIRKVAPDAAKSLVFTLFSLSKRLSTQYIVALTGYLGRHDNCLTITKANYSIWRVILFL